MAKKEKKKLTASFEVQLLPDEKAVAHKRLGRYDTPSLMSYARDYMQTHGKLFEIEGFICTYATLADIDKLADDLGLLQFKNWAEKNCTVHNSGYGRCGLERNVVYTWLRFPDGIWMLQGSYGQWMTWDRRPGKKGLENDPEKDARKSNYVSVESVEGFDYDAKRRFEQIQKEFSDAWRIAREKFRKELKNSGKAEKLAEKEANTDHVKRTQIRMDVVAQASKLMDMLETYIKSVNDETMTVKEVGELYFELTNLGALNKSMKEIYGAKMAKE